MRYVTVSVFSEQREKFAVADRRSAKILEVFAGADAKVKAQHKADLLNRAQAIGESGNVFFTLFGAVALVGALGVMTTTLLRGPLATVAAVNMTARADSAMDIAGRLAGQEFVAAGVDCDGDGFKEPAAPDLGPSHTMAVAAGGGGIPGTVGGSKADPWGTPFLFCGWDHGTGTTGCPAGLRTGAAAPAGEVAFAIVSAGPDRTFQTTCGDDPAYVTKAGDDRAFLFDQDAADALGAGGLWSLKSGDDTTATIDKDLEISTAATFGGDVFFSSTASLTLGGSFLLPTDAEIIGCAGPDRGALRFHDGTTSIQVCDGAGGWLPVGARSLLDLDDTPDDYAGLNGSFLRVDGAGVQFRSASFSDLEDAPGYSVGQAGQSLRVDAGGALAFSSVRFLDLVGAPASFGAAGDVLTVNAGADGLQYASASAFVGPAGAAGPQGPAGNDGADGSDGATGPQGPAGNDGADGVDGATGPQGPAGVVGPAGNDGADGVDGAAGPQGPAGVAGPQGASGNDGADGTIGDNGWSPVFGAATDGTRRVLQVIDWQGGTGTKPATGLYVGAGGLVVSMAAAVDVRGAAGVDGVDGAGGPQGPAGNDGADGATGPQGPAGVNGSNGTNGNTGWSPVFSLVNDGARRVLRVVDWQGGTGMKPTTGLYVGATGLVAAIASGVDVRGAAGATGATGPQGPAGAGNVSCTHREQIDGGLGFAISPCVGAEKVTGGGCRDWTNLEKILGSHPIVEGWRCVFSPASAEVVVTTICCL